MVQKKKAASCEPKRPRRSAAAGRAPIEPEVALGKALDLFRKDGFAGDLARRSQRRHRHEPAEPLRRVRRQARALHQELSALPRRRRARR